MGLERLTRSWLRPRTPVAKVIALPVISNHIVKWLNLEIRQSPDGRGYSLWCYECPSGFLIPMGGLMITVEELIRRLSSTEVHRYLCCLAEHCFDGNPDLCWRTYGLKHCWPGMYANECTAGNPAHKYNCLLVFLDSDATDIPDYPGIPKTKYMPFLEVMVPIRRKWTELFLWYGDDETPDHLGYKAKHFWLESSRVPGE